MDEVERALQALAGPLDAVDLADIDRLNSALADAGFTFEYVIVPDQKHLVLRHTPPPIWLSALATAIHWSPQYATLMLAEATGHRIPMRGRTFETVFIPRCDVEKLLVYLQEMVLQGDGDHEHRDGTFVRRLEAFLTALPTEPPAKERIPHEVTE
jgi:hypothetical protein